MRIFILFLLLIVTQNIFAAQNPVFYIKVIFPDSEEKKYSPYVNLGSTKIQLWEIPAKITDIKCSLTLSPAQQRKTVDEIVVDRYFSVSCVYKNLVFNSGSYPCVSSIQFNNTSFIHPTMIIINKNNDSYLIEAYCE